MHPQGQASGSAYRLPADFRFVWYRRLFLIRFRRMRSDIRYRTDKRSPLAAASQAHRYRPEVPAVFHLKKESLLLQSCCRFWSGSFCLWSVSDHRSEYSNGLCWYIRYLPGHRCLPDCRCRPVQVLPLFSHTQHRPGSVPWDNRSSACPSHRPDRQSFLTGGYARMQSKEARYNPGCPDFPQGRRMIPFFCRFYNKLPDNENALRKQPAADRVCPWGW